MTLNIINHQKESTVIHSIRGCRLPGKNQSDTYDVEIQNGTVTNVCHAQESTHWPVAQSGFLEANGRLLAPSFCHAHVHLDKCFILQDPSFEDYSISKGDFQEAMQVTGTAKSQFKMPDLLRRGRRLIQESVAAGVTAMRVFVEVDEVVRDMSLKAAIALKNEYSNLCYLQICAFAQLSLFHDDSRGEERRASLLAAADLEDVEVIGSTPYVETSQELSHTNVRWTIQQALQRRKHVDFHLDYSLNGEAPAMTKFVLDTLVRGNWPRSIVGLVP
ncbi:MAG: hypothetical protein Q9159_003153 [Coniocarpon cinnabarinum]